MFCKPYKGFLLKLKKWQMGSNFTKKVQEASDCAIAFKRPKLMSMLNRNKTDNNFILKKNINIKEKREKQILWAVFDLPANQHSQSSPNPLK